MNDEQTPALREAVENMANMREAYDNLSQAAEAYNTGKVQLAENITSKGVEASATETLPELAEKVAAISQETLQIDGGEMYAKQLFGSLETPNYWNLYEVLANLLSDGRLVSYGGILLAEYYRGYDSLALAGAGSGGAYVVSDKNSDGQFIMYTEDTTHTWATEFDGKCDRWVAYCFADEYHDFQITDTNTSPRSIFIGRKVGTIKSFVEGRVSQVVVPDGNELRTTNFAHSMPFGKRIVMRNIVSAGYQTLIIPTTTESVFLETDELGGDSPLYVSGGNELTIIAKIHHGNRVSVLNDAQIRRQDIALLYVEAETIGTGIVRRMRNIKEMWVVAESVTYYDSLTDYNGLIKKMYFPILEYAPGLRPDSGENTGHIDYMFLGYKTNDRNRYVKIINSIIRRIELKDGYQKPLDISKVSYSLTVESMAVDILDKLADNTGEDVLVLTIGASSLNRILADETYAPYVAEAQAKNWTIA